MRRTAGSGRAISDALGWAKVAVLLAQPLGVVAEDEVADGFADVVDGLEDAAVHDLLLEGSEQALDDAVRLRLSIQGLARQHAPALIWFSNLGHERAAGRGAAPCRGRHPCRDDRTALFAEGSYQPLCADGPGAEAVCAFARLYGDAGLVVAVVLPGTETRTGQTRIALPRGIRSSWLPVLAGGPAFQATAATVSPSSMMVLYADGRIR